ncbi:MAG: ATP-binding protein [Oscillibacter sp.]|nr:ATP-binding protein [Oscillibacter sp.]
MAYDEEILRRARQRFDAARQERRATLESRRENAYRRQPRLREIDAELRKTSARTLSAALRQGGDPVRAVRELQKNNLDLQAEKKSLLAQLRLPIDYLTEQPACPLCQDSGYTDGHMCRCLRKLCAQEQQKELSKMLDLGNQSFESFSLRWYSDRADRKTGVSPRKNMEAIYASCLDYARKFGPDSGNLLFVGSTGLGKTFLSAAIAREVSSAGFSVVYDSAAHIFERFEAEKFDRGEENAGQDVSRVLRCDLLILDDLGTEMSSPFIKSALYRIVNTRLMERRSTILSTNLEPKKLSKYYSPQIASRIEGEYQIFPFFGDDIRQLRKENDGEPPF